ncbi:hypothetical protein [Cryptosporangium sp. NPDC048952]|uniref:hypothetical protein n=1 Tax=Cryptosporangium sp. NPDC048952 TaxID=3363961 RepID=UPI00371906CB
MKLRNWWRWHWRARTNRYGIPVSRKRRRAALEQFIGSYPGLSAETDLEKLRGPWIEDGR